MNREQKRNKRKKEENIDETMTTRSDLYAE